MYHVSYPADQKFERLSLCGTRKVEETLHLPALSRCYFNFYTVCYFSPCWVIVISHALPPIIEMTAWVCVYLCNVSFQFDVIYKWAPHSKFSYCGQIALNGNI